jgi:diaminopropionate ammonia-lyase
MSQTSDNSNPMSFTPNYSRALEHFKAQSKYAVSPLHTKQLAGHDVLIKDETDRMGLGAFKALGGPYAIAQYIAGEWQAKHGESLTATRMQDADVKSFAADMTFVCASAGNHGLGVASGARDVGAKARIFLAHTVPDSFGARLESFGAEVVWAGDNYSQSVAAAVQNADDTGATLLADGTWEGYTELPKLVMEGYSVIGEETRAQLEQAGQWPTHVFLQAGVGGLACAMAYMIRHNWPVQPKIIVVEPDAAECLQASHRAGKPTDVTGPDSNMGRLDCKEPSMVAWHTLEQCDVSYVTLTDTEGQAGADQMTAMGVATTPSGAAGFTALNKMLDDLSSQAGFLPLVIISEGQV